MFYCPKCPGAFQHMFWCEALNPPQPLADWEKELLAGGSVENDGVGTAHFLRTDGKTVVVENVLFDTIGPGATNPGVISMDTNDEREIVHVPFVASWTIEF